MKNFEKIDDMGGSLKIERIIKVSFSFHFQTNEKMENIKKF